MGGCAYLGGNRISSIPNLGGGRLNCQIKCHTYTSQATQLGNLAGQLQIHKLYTSAHMCDDNVYFCVTNC